jgi:hypothetical protein
VAVPSDDHDLPTNDGSARRSHETKNEFMSRWAIKRGMGVLKRRGKKDTSVYY